MGALSFGFATLTLVLLLLFTYLLEASAFGRTYRHHDRIAQFTQNKPMKPKYTSSYSSYNSQSYHSQYSNSQSRVRPGPTINAVPQYRPQPEASHYGAGNHPMAQTFLDEHNKVRDVYGVPRLTWNSQLVPSAQRLADACAFRHTGDNPYGENIAAGQTSPQEVVSQWVEGPQEKLAYDPSHPQDSHFTQVVWEASQELGCAVTSCPTMVGVSLPQSPIQFWVCEYNPPGNVETLYTKNVHAVAGGSPALR